MSGKTQLVRCDAYVTKVYKAQTVGTNPLENKYYVTLL